MSGGKEAQSNGGNGRQEAPGFRDLNRRMDKVARRRCCNGARRGSRKRQTRARNGRVEGVKVDQNDGEGEWQVAFSCWDVALSEKKVSRGGSAKLHSVHFLSLQRQKYTTVTDPASCKLKQLCRPLAAAPSIACGRFVSPS